MKVKCVFQGGGAKLVTLVAAAEALEELERDKEIEVTEVAGTSAGAIAAYLFARHESMSKLRLKMKIAAAEVIEHFARKPTKIELLSYLAFGGTVYLEDEFRRFIRLIVAEQGQPGPNLSETRIPVHVRAADLRKGGKHTFVGGPDVAEEHDIPAEEALANSCAIPFALRTFGKNCSPYVDGGIVSNLVEPAVFTDHKGAIIAFSFDKVPQTNLSSLSNFLGSVVATMIDSSVAESVEKIRSVGGETCVLPNDFKTFDFQDAFDRGLSDTYANHTKEFIKTRIRTAVANLRARATKEDGPTRTMRLSAFCDAALRTIRKRSPYRVISQSVVCIAGGLTPGQPATPDHLTKEVVIEATGDEIVAFFIGIAKNDAHYSGGDLNWEIVDASGRPADAVHEVVETQTAQGSAWHAHFYLVEPVPKAACPLRIRVATSHTALMSDLLRDGGTEWMRTVSHQPSVLPETDFVLCVPRGIGPFKMVDLLENADRATDLTEFDEMKATWCGGRPLRVDELAPYKQAHLHLVGYEFIGWRATNVPPNGYSGVLVEKVRQR